jgi:signal transduction histidine kinase
LKIHLQTHQDEKFIYLAVADNGLGIDLERHKDAMFALYSRFHEGIIPGKGIGLNLVKTQVETLGGKVTVKSQPGEGTTFTVSFLKA